MMFFLGSVVLEKDGNFGLSGDRMKKNQDYSPSVGIATPSRVNCRITIRGLCNLQPPPGILMPKVSRISMDPGWKF